MPSPTPAKEGENNRLLLSLPQKYYRQFSRNFELVPLNVKDVIYEKDKPIDHVYFPQSGVISLLVTMDDGSAVEAATVGNEGMVGVGSVMDAIHVHLKTICQVPGTATRVKASVFRREMQRSDALMRLMHRYTQALMIQFTQGVACNRLHTIEQRCARWLLMTHDRVAHDAFTLTQEFLGQMLGVRRASVTVVAGLLQKMGLIQYSRGAIRIVDRQGLERQACECYAVIKGEIERLTNGR